jgi:hypothetical protein
MKSYITMTDEALPPSQNSSIVSHLSCFLEDEPGKGDVIQKIGPVLDHHMSFGID